MAWTRSFTTYTTASAEAVWKRHITPADWVQDDPVTTAAAFTVPPRTGDTGTVTAQGSTRTFTFTEVRPGEVMTQVFALLPGAQLVLGHTLERTVRGLRVTHTVSLTGPLGRFLVPIAGWPLVRSRPAVVHSIVTRALDESTAAAR